MEKQFKYLMWTLVVNDGALSLKGPEHHSLLLNLRFNPAAHRFSIIDSGIASIRNVRND